MMREREEVIPTKTGRPAFEGMRSRKTLAFPSTGLSRTVFVSG
jgi:hypothetical protein